MRAKALREALSQPKKERVSPSAEGIGQTVVREEEKPIATKDGKPSIEDLRRMELEELERIEAEEKAKQKENDRLRQSQVRSFTANTSAPAAPGRPLPTGGAGREEGETESMRDRMHVERRATQNPKRRQQMARRKINRHKSFERRFRP